MYLERDGKHTRLERGKSYPIQKGDKIKTAPDRVKGSPVGSYFGVKEPWRKELIRQQVANLAEKRFRRGQVELDDTCNYVLFHNFTLTSAWRQANPDSEFVTIMLLLPDQYPDLPPNGFYMPDYLKPPPGETHWFASDYTWGGNAASQGIKMQGWNWYCTHVAEGSWSPARLQRVEDWSKGDNLWDIMRMVTDVLTDPTAN
ncbi:MAG: hypothetical protein FWH52_05630 [Synergistaceae bacterium]|nr:hypothetical protein [Synergistaceae bacterium]